MDWKTILKLFFKKYDGDVKWTDLALVKTVMNLSISYDAGNFLTEDLPASAKTLLYRTSQSYSQAYCAHDMKWNI